MIRTFSARLCLAAAITVAGFAALPANPAQAEENWLSRIIRGRFETDSRERTQPPAEVTPKKRAVSVPKIAAPRYFNYQAAAPVRVDFAKVVAAAAAQPGLTLPGGASFTAAAPALEGFDLTAEKADAAAIAAHYAAKPDFIWVSGFGPNARARAALRVLESAGDEGLDAEHYAVIAPTEGFSMDDMGGRLQALIRFEMTLSARVLRYARDVAAGRVDPNRLSGYHDLPVLPFDPAKALSQLAATNDAGAWLAEQAPHGDEYKSLRAAMAKIRREAEADIIVDSKLLLRPGGQSPEFAKLMEIVWRDGNPEIMAEHGRAIMAARKSDTYTQDLVPVVKAIQKARGLNPDGIIGPRTVSAISPVSKADRMEKIRLALERLRWLPHDLGARRVFINQPEFLVRYYEQDDVKLSMRIVVGKKSNQTSFFYDEIERVEFNPYWGVPRSIIVNEMLPRLVNDPGYLDRAGYEVTDSKGRRIPSSTIDWGAHGANIPYNVRQTPGEANALGELKIMFPNKHAIYMHDTPSKSLFNRDARAFSHGCVRLQKPREMAAAVLGTSMEDIRRELAAGHSSRNVPVKIPVYVAYFTAWPQEDGTIGFFTDVYERDDFLTRALDAVREARAASS
ncbi:murein L,D-transpeptidase [Zhengella sp. ZM62]|uniref:L,D-transpeptidase family protein n=1 Tax=Zhengella sedimenti TaxID=3390035 RepID=UPI00397655CF